MKKIVLILVAALAAASVMSSCGSTQECPAYNNISIDAGVATAS